MGCGEDILGRKPEWALAATRADALAAANAYGLMAYWAFGAAVSDIFMETPEL